MTQVNIYIDEAQFMAIRPAPVGEDDFPSFFTPVEVPDEVYAEYEAARSREFALRTRIVNDYGVSTDNPDFEAQIAAWKEREDIDGD